MRGTERSLRMTGAFGVIAVSSALLLAACGGSTSTSNETLNPNADLSTQSLVVSNWDAYMPEDLPTKFEEKTGAEVTVTKHATNEEVVAKITSGGDSGIDVAFVSGQYAQALAEQGLLADIDPALIPNLTNLYPEATQLPYDVGNKYSVPYA